MNEELVPIRGTEIKTANSENFIHWQQIRFTPPAERASDQNSSRQFTGDRILPLLSVLGISSHRGASSIGSPQRAWLRVERISLANDSTAARNRESEDTPGYMSCEKGGQRWLLIGSPHDSHSRIADSPAKRDEGARSCRAPGADGSSQQDNSGHSKIPYDTRCSNAPYRPIRGLLSLPQRLNQGIAQPSNQREEFPESSAEAASSELRSEKRASNRRATIQQGGEAVSNHRPFCIAGRRCQGAVSST